MVVANHSLAHQLLFEAAKTGFHFKMTPALQAVYTEAILAACGEDISTKPSLYATADRSRRKVGCMIAKTCKQQPQCLTLAVLL